MHPRINFTIDQARKVVASLSPGSVYYSEAQRVLRENGNQGLAAVAPVNVTAPVPGIDVPGLTYQETNDDDGDGL